MLNFNVILCNQQNETLLLCREISEEIGIGISATTNIAEFLLQIIEKELHLAIFECNQFSQEYLGWLQLIRKIRPKIPIIFICDELERDDEAKMYEMGIFYVGIRPLHRVLLSEVMLAAIKCYLKS